MNVTHEISYTARHCYTCGTFWYVEARSHGFAECPRCTPKEVRELEARIAKLERRIRGYKGALKRKAYPKYYGATLFVDGKKL